MVEGKARNVGAGGASEEVEIEVEIGNDGGNDGGGRVGG